MNLNPLSPEEQRVILHKGTEMPFTGEYENTFEEGTYVCRQCGAALYTSNAKFHSGCGWPSFFEPISPDVVTEHRDVSFGMARTEVRCAVCDGHLGHVFPDGPPPTGLRYCINSVSLEFRLASTDTTAE